MCFHREAQRLHLLVKTQCFVLLRNMLRTYSNTAKNMDVFTGTVRHVYSRETPMFCAVLEEDQQHAH